MSEKQYTKITATLDKIVFQTEDTGFLIGAFFDSWNNQRFSGLGTVMNPAIGMDYNLTGTWQENDRYGKQFKIDYHEMVQPKDVGGIYKYIVRVCKFVGATVGHAIIDAYGDQTLEVMKTEPERLAAEIKGITKERAVEIQETLITNQINESMMVELGTLLDVPGIRKSLMNDLIRDQKSNAAEFVRQNPYLLTRYKGIGFPLADRVALNIGFARDSIFRKEAATIHVLQQNNQQGSVWMHWDNVVAGLKELIQVPDIEAGLIQLIDVIYLVKNINNYVAFAQHADDESYIATKLMMGTFVEEGDIPMGLEVC